MSLTHEFFLLSRDFDLNDRYEWYRTHRNTWADKSDVSDETIQYMTDFLNWLPSYNPETKECHKGLNYYGVTVIAAMAVHHCQWKDKTSCMRRIFADCWII